MTDPSRFFPETQRHCAAQQNARFRWSILKILIETPFYHYQDPYYYRKIYIKG